MTGALAEGILMGLVLSMIIGPVFFALIQHSMSYGFKHAVFMALGILLSDSMYVLISHYGVSSFSKNPMIEGFLGYAGGMILIGFGIATFVKKGISRPNTGGFGKDKSKKRTGFLKGFTLNGINPFVLLFWISVAGLVNMKVDYSAKDVWFYYLGILGTVFLIDVLKAYIAKRLSQFVTPKLMLNLNRLVAAVLVFFGTRMIYFAVQNQPLL
ncbi:LysE family translocator [Pararhodonellum marinum]|uniref:LysE family translocator n=1 Tax=Pararhodonellum marinum TaxID=2755358 RepID=UPI00189066A0|nr:LysE family transporter [Pararhodonellum marinum]